MSEEDAGGNVETSDSTMQVTLAIGTNPGGGSLNCVSNPVTVSSGVAALSCSINKTGTGYTLTASGSGLISGTSSTFSITPGTATKLAINTPASTTVTGGSFSVQVQEEDANSNVVTTDSATTVALSLATNPGTGSLACKPSSSTAVSGGVATFTCSLNQAGVGFLLKATSGSLTAASTSAFNVVAAATAVAITSSPSTSLTGQSVTYTATVSVASPGAGSPTGSVTFTDGSSSICSAVALSSGSASCTNAPSTAATHQVVATYSGDSNFASSASSQFGQAVSQASTSTALSSSTSSGTAPASVNLTAQVSVNTPGAGSPTGSINFLDGSSTLCAGVALSSGKASCSASLTSSGNHSITAVYGSDSNFAGSTSSAITVNVAPANTAPATPSAPPAAPTGLTVQQVGSSVAVASWNAVAGTNPTYFPTWSWRTKSVVQTGTSTSIRFSFPDSVAPGTTITLTVYAMVGGVQGPSSQTSFTLVDAAVLDPRTSESQTGTTPTSSFHTAPVVVPAPPGSSASPVTVSTAAVGEGTVTVQAYKGNPVESGGATFAVSAPGTTATPTSFVDIRVTKTATGGLSKFSFSICNLAKGQQVEWYKSSAKAFELVSADLVRYGTLKGQYCAIVTLTSHQRAGDQPTLAEMGGTVFAVVTISRNEIGAIAVSPTGTVYSLGSAKAAGSVAPIKLGGAAADVATTSDGKGYWIATSTGQVFAFGDAKFFGSFGSLHSSPRAPISKLVPTADDKGYYLVAQNGSVYHFGDAKFLGSLVTRGIRPPTSIVSMAVTPDGKGYWLASYTGQVYAFGDAPFHGSFTTPKSMVLPYRIVGITPTKDGKGYWLATVTGQVFSFGDAKMFGQLKLTLPLRSLVGIAASPSGKGYSLFDSTGQVYGFGDGKSYSVPRGFKGTIVSSSIAL
ncbi:MAG TPA: Ig-like domain-containing protein [Acidimicrobiales bacterium]|nr:Ig-like domain-containing protein [Acidimicrobiales bacterium]